MIYSADGTASNNAYGIEGNALIRAYDLNGGQLLGDRLTVMTFNVQDYDGINSQLSMLQAIFNRYDTDIIGFQEFCRDGVVPTVASNALVNYPYLQLTNHVNYNAVASKFALSDWTIADYETQDPYDVDTRKETRTYMRGYFTIGEKRIAFFNTHLCVTNSAPRYAQMAELFALAEQEEYCVITGDFNSTEKPMSASASDYINQYKLFVDAGYNLANNSPVAGFTNTHSSETSVANLSALTSALDSIIVSGNIDIDSVTFDRTKLLYQNGQKFDHIPVIAELVIN